MKRQCGNQLLNSSMMIIRYFLPIYLFSALTDIQLKHFDIKIRCTLIIIENVIKYNKKTFFCSSQRECWGYRQRS